jgi:hypothetical protein
VLSHTTHHLTKERPMPIRRTATRALTAAGVATLVTLAPVGAAHGAAGDTGTTRVSGLAVPDEAGTCTEQEGAFRMTGSLDGCYYMDELDVQHESQGGGLVATGREHFVVCLGSPPPDGVPDTRRCGTIFTTFTFTAKFASDGSEIHGRCHHPIVGGDGGFAGVTGVINMHDLPNGCAEYDGHLKL